MDLYSLQNRPGDHHGGGAGTAIPAYKIDLLLAVPLAGNYAAGRYTISNCLNSGPRPHLYIDPIHTAPPSVATPRHYNHNFSPPLSSEILAGPISSERAAGTRDPRMRFSNLRIFLETL